ncbi:non-ribosomal peptide synthase/polyketide synthase [Archangium lansingense]|uniref:Non-ribosomal peptide synthase/polyketide synthase n=1 Tax=Archangium lansingense TaxID=2995310 RepID=A0ABT4AA01_9BACT|nr:non-ribosomal peptide synthase/polyketide synthase [Archangium lansinium]MCY1078492.1 non-ribosomal peptide synthase/polyketide synthase [Archangium lansinium]
MSHPGRPSSATTLLELLETRSSAHREQPLYTFLEDGDEQVLSYEELDLRARRIGATLQSVARAGERAVLLYPPGLEYVAGFFGCIYAGLVAVPAYPPEPSRLERTLPRLRAIIRDARASVVLTTAFIREMGESLFEQAPELAALRWVATDAIDEGVEAGWQRPEPAWDSLAFLQYTSGSTGDPKGVRLSHGNLLHNLSLISHAFEVRADSVGVIWLPPYHDMGLIGGILQPLYAGFHTALMSPLAFLRRPRLWLEALSRFGGTISGGPCFAFDLCVRKVPPPEREGLDLSRWELAFCGAEPIRPEVMTRFAEAFAPAGFRPGSFYPCYGLAEGTLIASGGKKGEGVLVRTWEAAALERNAAVEAVDGPGARPLVGCGRVMPEQSLVIVDPETRRPCLEGRVGEIWISGPSVAQGYWERAEESEAAFQARLADGGPEQFLRSGDLGVLHGGELFVVGRRKDLIILRGRNLHPQDLELTIERSHPALRPGCGAAFSIEVEGEERLAVVHEVDPRKPWTPDEVVGTIRRALSESHEVQLHALVLLEPGALPKTSSGKIQRRACRTELLAGWPRALLFWREADGVAQGPAAPALESPTSPGSVEELETWLVARLSARLRVRPEELAKDVPITSFGLDSLAAVELAHDIEHLGAVLRMDELLHGPTVASLARTIFAARGTSGDLGLASIPRRPDGTDAPLSSAQQRLWIFEQLERGNPAYNLPSAIRLVGGLDEGALERSFTALVERHEVLRATFQEIDGSPRQVISSTPSSVFRRVDLQSVPAPSREEEALRLARQEASAAFDLARGSLLRATLIRLDAREHLLVVVMHHIVSDGASFALLARELSALYAAFLQGSSPSLQPLPVQYPDYALWRRERDTKAALAESLSWWRQRLAGAPAALELPTDRPRPPSPSYRGARVALHLPEALSTRLEALGRGEGATLFMTLLAAFQVLLLRHSGQEDLCVGTPVNGRDRASLEGLIGCFLDLLVLRSSLSGDPSFRELLARTRATSLEAFAHRDVPFERIAETLPASRDRSRAPLFQVLFVLLPEPGAELVLPGLEARCVDLDPGATAYDLTLSLAHGAKGLEGWLEYATDLFDATTVTRMAERLLVLLDAITTNPDQRLSALPLLSEDERRRVLVDWNATRTDYPEECVHALFAAQTARTPDTVAVVCGDESLTYRELDRRANAVARRLRAQGVGPEVVVGLCAERSLELVTGLLGILKAGGAYLPLDPSYPESRLAFMLEDSGAPVVLAHRHLAGALPPGARTVVPLDPPGGPELADEAPASDVRSDNLAYILYTSGSTGRPKGVLIPHRNLTNFFTGMDARVGTTPGSWLAVTSVSFDISVLELLWTLARGFKVAVQGEQGALAVSPRRTSRRKPLGFSLFYFASDDGAQQGGDRYRLLLEGARFADRHGFEAVWTPERHFHSFGGLYPNPSLTGAAIAAITERVGIRAGSVVLPLHHPVRVAEEWSVVDNLSKGRVGLSVAPGWNADDFVFAPDRYAERRALALRDLDTVRRLWRGESVSLPGGTGAPVEVRIRPSPVQRELPIWLTAAGNPETFREAGRLGAGVLTHLLGQRWEELRERVALYREAWREAGHPGEGHVTLMLHTFVGQDVERVRETVEGPFRRYLSSSADLMRGLVRTFGLEPASVRPGDLEALTERAFGRYFEEAGLFGTPRTSREQVARIEALGVDEVACLIDFGVASDTVLASLPALDALRQRSERDFRLQGQLGGTVPAQIQRHGITHLQCTPSLAQALLLEPEAPAALTGLSRMMVGGEALAAELAARLRGAVGGELLNMYGPTETTIWSSTHRVDGAPGPIPIGTPIANTALYVLDAQLRPAPIGVPGELFIGGAGVARGYHARPELTAERFLPDPFSAQDGARMYRTGDLARWRADGTVEFLGRVDHQLKIRGFRVEPGEIEAALEKHPDVRQAVVVAREDLAGSARLVAYVIPRPEEAPSSDALRVFARRLLPEHLVPSAIVTLDAFPLTPNGKVDRKALPAPDGLRDAARGHVAPRTSTERRVAEIWSELLGVEQVGAGDDFFALGGHSLLAARAVSRLRESFGVELALRELFEAGTVASIAERIDALPKTALATPPLVPGPREGALPLSFAQQRLWFLEQLDPQNAAYNDSVVVRVEGVLDVAVLERCLLEVVRRHMILRTTFRSEDGKAVQLISAEARLPLARVDLTDLSGSARSEAVSRLADEESLRPFELVSGPPLRASLLRLGEREHVLLVVLHHLVTDGWSLGVLVREVAALYQAFSAGEDSPLPELALQYVDYAAWQRGWLRGEALEAQLAYWRSQLESAPRSLELPTDHPRPAVRSSQGASRHTVLAPELSQAVKALAHREGATPFMVLLAGFSALLSRYSGQDDLCVGTPVAGRNRTELEGLIGCFVNTLVLRVSLAGNPSFRELLGRARETVLGAFAHQDAPFEKLVEVLQPERDLGRSPLFQVMLVLQEDPLPELSMPGLHLRALEQESRTSKFDLRLILLERAGGISATLEFSTDLFEPATAERMLAHLRVLLESAVREPAQCVQELPLLTSEERRQVLETWNDTRLPRDAEACLHRLIEAQVDRTPDAVAVSFEGSQLTYRELDRRANQLAHYLRARGVGPDRLVALCAERSLEMVVGLLGILKAGGAYVPVDPDYPRERVEFMLADASAPVLLTQARLASGLPHGDAAVVCLDSEWEIVGRERAERPDVALSGSHLAYVIYTSGSTGRPKGAMNTHAAICNRLLWMQEAYGLGAEDRVLQKTPFSFDVSVWEFFWPLMTGARLVMARPGGHKDPAWLAGIISSERITTLHFVPSMLRHFLEAPELDARFSPKRVICSGEVLSPELRELFHTRLRSELHNLYGPTEAAVDVTAWACVPEDRRPLVPIGRPIANARMYVLDQHLRPVPPGVPGELYIGGVPLARGYWRRPELTAERFIPEPFAETLGGRLYRTGDRARFLADGAIEYLGRLDDQVKVRGFRIEPGEIESALLRHPHVRSAAVVVREDVPGDRRLVAYVIPAGDEPAPTSLRSFLGNSLPEYMVPSAFVTLEALPLSPSGKLDRRALPAPARVRAGSGDSSVEPRNEMERRLAEIWAGVLGLERVGAHDRFFELGGDSILGLQVIARARQAGLRLTVRQLFQHQTLAELARVAESGRVIGEQGPVLGPVPFTPIQRWFLERELPEAHHFNQALLLETREPVDAALLERALRALVEHHDALRSSLTRVGTGWAQVCSAPGREVPLRRVDLSALPEPEQAAELERVASEVQGSLSLDEGLLLRAVLFDRGAGRTGRLLLVIHHLAVDGVSWRVLLEDLQSALHQLGRGEPLALPAKTTSFQAWARRLEAHARSEAVAAELPFWLAETGDEVPVLPRDRREGSNTPGSENTVTVTLEPEVTRALLHELPSALRAGVDDVLLAGVARALSRWTGQGRLRIDMEGHGREDLFEDVDLSRTVGWFTALYPVHFELQDASPEKAIEAVRAARERRAGRGLGYGLLRYLRQDDAAEQLRARPSAEVCFNYLGQLDAGALGASRFGLAPESVGPSHGPGGLRSHVLEVVARAAGGRLELSWVYSEALHDRGTIEALAADCAEALRTLARNGVPEERYPLSPLQHGLLFHVLLEPGTEAYFEQRSWMLTGALKAHALREAWALVLERHPSLRTDFLWQGLEEPLQVVRSRVETPWNELDWRGVPAEEQSRRLESFLREDRARGFELTRAPLMRFALIRLEDQVHRFVWSFHHLLLDGWSLARVLAEVLEAYAALVRGESWRPSRAPDFRSYIEWLGQRRPERDEAFWRELLSGVDAPTPLPGEGESGAERGAGEREVVLDERATTALQDFARRHGLTPSTLVHGAWALLLSRYGGGEDVVFGTTLAGRPPELPGIEEAVGVFIHSLPMRVRLRSWDGLVPWLRELQARLVELGQREHVPLARLQGWSEVPRGTPLFESLLVFENYPVDAALARGVAGLELGDFRPFERTHYPLTAVAVPGRELRLKLLHRSERVSADTAARLLEHWRALLDGMVSASVQRLGDVPLLSAAERRQVLVEWNATRTAFPREATLHALFEAQVARTPESVAVSFGDVSFTYAELERRANRLAHRLLSLGVTRGSAVGLCVERSADLIVGVLGILKAGAAYVPLDPAYPSERLAWMIEDARVPVLLTQQRLRDGLSPGSARVLVLDGVGELEGLPDTAPESRASAEELAYVIYTSGSTGVPKGVCVPHRAVVRLVVETDFIQLVPEDRVAQASNASFDAATFEIWGALLHGARLVGVEREVALAPKAFATWLREQAISVLFITTAWFNQIATEVPDAFRGLRQLHFGGEAVDPRPVRAVLREGPPQRLLHVYGPTESTTFASWHLVRELPAGSPTLPIGRPLANTEQYVLDEALEPVPPGGAGELWIGGDGLAWGYLGRPELTADRFRPHPFSAEPGARLYRTGDRVRLLADGSVVFLGRVDAQVKVRGFRVEPGEIQAVLLSHPAVREAAVLAREDAPGGSRRLVAYVVPGSAQGVEPRALHRFLADRLPEYMVPSAFVVLERLPLTPNGKVDRRALPAPSEVQGAVDASHVAPRGPVEELLASLFGELLGVPRVGAHDSFFELGGHSLLATRVVSRILATFGVVLSLREFFEAPTVARLAERISAAHLLPEAVRPPPIVPVPREGPLPLSLMQERLWLLDQLQPGTSLYNVSWASWLEGPLHLPSLERALSGLLQRHEALRTTFVSEAGEPSQRIHPQVELSLPVVELRELPESEREVQALRAASDEARRPFDLARGPLIRALLLCTGETTNLLVLSLHHIISDGWSLGVTIREFLALYEAELTGRASPLPIPVLQPVDHAVWQRGWLRGEALETQLGYWRERLAGAPPVLELPTDFPRPSVQRFRGASLRVQLPATLSSEFRAICRREGVTPFMGLLAAFQLLLSRSSGQEDVCVGSPISGRHHAGLEELLGFFVNTLVLRTRLSPGLTFRDLLGRVRETTLGAYAHQDLPFEKLVEALQPPRSLSHAPLVQTVLALQEAPKLDGGATGLSFRPVDLGTDTAKFDLTLSLTDAPEGFAGTLEYDADLFTPATAARMMEHLRVLLEGAVADPGRRLGELPMMDAAEQRRLLIEWNSTRVDYPRDACLSALFEAQAERTPDAVAVELGDQRLTYRELDRRANQLARHLLRRGVGSGTPVGLCVQRSLELVVGTLGILKAGGAYVPLDPTYPRERLAFMVEDTRVPVVLAQRSVLPVLPESGAAVVLLDEGWTEVAREPEDSPGVRVPGEALAYVMYTSGSTGRPKGVCIPQRAVARLVLGSSFARWGPDEVFLQLAPICFDAATFELWGALLHGARLILFPPHTPTVDELKAVLDRHGVTTLWLTAALFEQISAMRPEALQGVRRLLAGGDVLPPAAVRERLSRGGVLVNGYGPTENTTFTACHVMEGVAPEGAIPIGQPIANTWVYVVDRELRPVPVGVPGELLMGGDGLAWGYLGRPELTAERFIPDPFGLEPGGRLYRSGDRVRHRADGTLEFLGRLDAQVKVRGFRVEPGEVEEALRKHPDVAETVVVARPDPAGGKRLVAYAVPRSGQVLDSRALRVFLAERLPEHMVPAAIMPLAALPLSPNGKVDRGALPEPEVSRPAGVEFVEATTPLEQRIAGVLAKVLGVERVGVEDHFFADLGGNSMSVVKACALLREELKRDVPATRFFEHSTVRALAASLERDGEAVADEQDNEVHEDRAEQRRQAFRRQGRRRDRGNG